jgi:cytochrome c biogenesis protein ResB
MVGDTFVLDYFPKSESVSELIPEKPRRYLLEALSTVHAPSSSIMVCASSVDSMLKEKGYRTGSLYTRIDEAKNDHLITEGMAQWAHRVRLDANDERHVDDNAAPPTSDDARRSITFAKALAEFLFVLPARVSEGLEESQAS